MEARAFSSGGAIAGVTTEQACAMCGNPVTPDALGLMECRCGWGGPGDPLESARGLRGVYMRVDRRLANSMARGDLARMAAKGGDPGRLGFIYIVMLTLVSTLVLVLLWGALVALIWVTVVDVLAHAWLGATITLVGSLILLYLLYPHQPHPKGIVATRQRFPRLAAALDEVGARVKAPAPHRVILVPGSAAYVYQHRPLHRFFRRELVMGLGVGMLAPLTIQDAKALMAHELAHYRRGDTFLHRHFWRAETALHRIIESLVEGTASTDAGRPWWGNSSTIVYAKILVLVATLPISVLWWLVHLLRLAESRHAEFAADHLSARTYGAQAFINGLTGLAMASNTLRGAGASLRDEMLRRGERNIYGVLRDHYAALPANVLRDLRAQTVTGFRSLELTHPIRPDRLRAVSLVSHTDTPSDEMARPAMELLVPAGASDAEEIERALTELWLNQGKRKRR